MDIITEDEIEGYITDLSINGMKPLYGCALNDIMVFKWEEYFEPSVLFKQHGWYERFSNFVHSSTVSGLLYRGVRDDVDEFLDYSNNVSSWTSDINIALNFTSLEEPTILRCTFENAPGVHLKYGSEDEYVIGESVFRQVIRIGKFVDVVVHE